MVNSAFFGVTRPISDIKSAGNYLGISTLKSLLLSVEIFKAFTPLIPVPDFSLQDLEYHARLTASIACQLPVPKHLADVALTAGMLHDVGKLIRAWKYPDRFGRLGEEAHKERIPLHKVERRDSGFTHAEIGAYLLGLWGLPYPVVGAVALHHDPNRVPHQSFDAASAVYVANLLANERELSSAASPPEDGAANSQPDLVTRDVQDAMAEWRAMTAEISVPRWAVCS